MIHVLVRGISLCLWLPPALHPVSDDTWVSLRDYEKVDCPECVVSMGERAEMAAIFNDASLTEIEKDTAASALLLERFEPKRKQWPRRE